MYVDMQLGFYKSVDLEVVINTMKEKEECYDKTRLMGKPKSD